MYTHLSWQSGLRNERNDVIILILKEKKNLIFAPFNPQGKIAFVCARKKEKRKLFIQYGSNEKSLVIFNNRTSKPIFTNREKV